MLSTIVDTHIHHSLHAGILVFDKLEHTRFIKQFVELEEYLLGLGGNGFVDGFDNLEEDAGFRGVNMEGCVNKKGGGRCMPSCKIGCGGGAGLGGSDKMTGSKQWPRELFSPYVWRTAGLNVFNYGEQASALK
jgi:hypothetical protein